MTDSEAMERVLWSGLKEVLGDIVDKGGDGERLLVITSRRGAERILAACGENAESVRFVMLSDGGE